MTMTHIRDQSLGIDSSSGKYYKKRERIITTNDDGINHISLSPKVNFTKHFEYESAIGE